MVDLTGDALSLSALDVGDHYAVASRSFAQVGSLSQFAFDVENRARDQSPPSNLTLRVPVELACNDTAFGACPRLLYLHSFHLSGDAANMSVCKIVDLDYHVNPLVDGFQNKTITKVLLPGIMYTKVLIMIMLLHSSRSVLVDFYWTSFTYCSCSTLIIRNLKLIKYVLYMHTSIELSERDSFEL